MDSSHNCGETKLHKPGWRPGDSTSAWQRTKDAFRRDWEQTKADFFRTRGIRLGQSAGDTLKQIGGAQPVPPLTERTHPLVDGDVDVVRAQQANQRRERDVVRATMERATTESMEAVRVPR